MEIPNKHCKPKAPISRTTTSALWCFQVPELQSPTTLLHIKAYQKLSVFPDFSLTLVEQPEWNPW